VPEIGSTPQLFFDLAKGFIERGHVVDVITSYPRLYTLGSIEDKMTPIQENIYGINIYRCKLISIRDNKIARGLEHFILPRVYYRKYLEISKRYDICLMVIPPLPLYYLAREIKKKDGTNTILIVQDFHPQELVDCDYTRNPFIIKILEYIQRQAYRNADYISVMSEGGVDYIATRGCNRKKIAHIYHGIKNDDVAEFSSVQSFKKQQGIEDKFLISYAGMVSPFQGLDSILDVAKRLTEHAEIIFYIVGDGMSKEHLKKRIVDEGIKNVRLLPFQNRKEYFNIINSSDIELITLDKRMKAPCIPGKLCNLMSLGKPVIAVVPLESETGKIMEKYGCGLAIEPDNIEDLKFAILTLKSDRAKREILGKRSREFFMTNLDLDRCIDRYETIFNIVSNRSRAKE
jgi:glycosyltransferase involved in cell wall biosynthesis